MRRLAVIDIAHGGQPFFSADGTVALVFNGEIYNHLELRRELERSGVCFKTQCDGEVLTHLYRIHGDQMGARLRGAFAIAIHDARQRRLLLIRDRLGEKPLYTLTTSSGIYFSSELKPLLPLLPGVELDRTAVDAYLRLQYVVEPLSLVRGIEKVPAGTWMSVESDTLRVTRGRYWSMYDLPPDPGEPVSVVRSRIMDVFSSIAAADVPVGVALSGGLDSCLIASIATATHSEPLHAFSVGFRARPALDERNLARLHAESLGMHFHDVEMDDDEVVAGFEDSVRGMDEPFGDLSAHAYSAIARECRRAGVPVLLTGHGADELFWGYGWVASALVRSRRRAKHWARACGELGARRSPAPPGQMCLFDLHPDYREAAAWLRAGGGREWPAYLCEPPPWDNVPLGLTRLMMRLYLQGNGLNQLDRLGMEHGVEVRVPFVDYRLVEAVLSLRVRSDDSGLGQKHWLREAMRAYLPADVSRRQKRPFEMPYVAWRERILSRFGHRLLDGYLVDRGWLDAGLARRLVQEKASPRVVVSTAYKMLLLEVWCRTLSTGDFAAAGT